MDIIRENRSDDQSLSAYGRIVCQGVCFRGLVFGIKYLQLVIISLCGERIQRKLKSLVIVQRKLAWLKVPAVYCAPAFRLSRLKGSSIANGRNLCCQRVSPQLFRAPFCQQVAPAFAGLAVQDAPLANSQRPAQHYPCKIKPFIPTQ